ncbi:MAG TPA: helix-turn-helix domain-containing protein [Candidatus Methylacidiphilales bacterium]|jgi:AraC family transcriptional regulator of arabinose operon|nr:helix-turn-helix domain-containing protein [Candidatus Methylacidiphilales bacterium]
MQIFKETPAPPVGALHARHWDARGPVHGWRPRGTKDWLLFYTVLGHCLIRHRKGEFKTNAGDIILYQPGTPQDYGQHNPDGRWRHVWVHWVPRTEVLEWLNWPEINPGLRQLHLPVELRRLVLKELVLAATTLSADVSRGEALAQNALERALLYCHRVNPRQGGPRWHPRIQQAVDYLAKNRHEQHRLEDTARRFGFSRARFASLFRQQIGQPPRRYLETWRLTHARHLLTYTNQTLAQIAEHVGYSSAFHLSLRFKKHFGQSPRAFRRRKEERWSTS